MANDMVNASSASVPSVVSNDKSGRQAAQSLVLPSDLASTRAEDVRSAVKQGASQNVLAINAEEPLAREQQKENAEKQAQNLQELSQLKGWAVSFQVDSDLNTTVIKVIDADTQKMIRQIPSEDMLTLNKRIQALRDEGDSGQGLSGLLLDSQI